MATAWRHWLPKSTELTIKRGGYYSYLVRPGLRVIVLNNNVCYNTNWWVMYHFDHQAIQLNWLHDTLLKAEANNEVVHLLTHMPTGSGSSYAPWSREFHKIMDRFYHVIAALFNGHTHKDEFSLYYATESKQQYAINVAWNGGSTVTYTDKNPNYKVYYVDEETFVSNSLITSR